MKQCSDDVISRGENLKSLKEKEELTEEALKEIFKKYKSLQEESAIISKAYLHPFYLNFKIDVS
jgi:hypothetical protein